MRATGRSSEVLGQVHLRHATPRDEVGQLVSPGVRPRFFDRLHGALSLRWQPSATGYRHARHGAAVLGVVDAVVVVVCDDGFNSPNGTVVVVAFVVVVVVVAVIVWT